MRLRAAELILRYTEYAASRLADDMGYERLKQEEDTGK